MTQPQTLYTHGSNPLAANYANTCPLTLPPSLLVGDPVTLSGERPLACLTIISGILARPCRATTER